MKSDLVNTCQKLRKEFTLMSAALSLVIPTVILHIWISNILELLVQVISGLVAQYK